jgi:transcriptional regulator with XRE-family HTH domain
MLRRFRHQRGITGAELATSVGVTQGTISKIERGWIVPDLDFLSKFAHTLRLKREEAADLMGLAGVLPGGVTPERALQYLPVDFLQADWSERRQVTLAMTEARSTTIRVFNPLLVPGLLQTESYATCVLEAAGVNGERKLKQAVRARVRRQHVLHAPDKRATFILTEAALLARLAAREVLLEQIKRIGQLAMSQHVCVGVIPMTASLRVVPPPAFYLLDRRVYLELPHGDLWLLARSNAYPTYANLFERLASLALRGSELVVWLDRILDQQP